MFKVLLLAAVVAVSVVNAGDKSMKLFREAGIATDLIPQPPPKEMKVNYSKKIKAKYGNCLNVADVKGEPVTEWAFPDYEAAGYFTLVAIDADYPNSAKGTGRLLWKNTNISAENPTGDVIAKYEPPTGDNHRIVFLVYYHAGPIEEPACADVPRDNFNVAAYAKENGLTILAGNFFYTQ